MVTAAFKDYQAMSGDHVTRIFCDLASSTQFFGFISNSSHISFVFILSPWKLLGPRTQVISSFNPCLSPFFVIFANIFEKWENIFCYSQDSACGHPKLTKLMSFLSKITFSLAINVKLPQQKFCATCTSLISSSVFSLHCKNISHALIGGSLCRLLFV